MATEILRPNAAGDYTNITTQYPASTYHWDKVDEASSDDDTTYIEVPGTSELRDVFHLGASSIPTGSTINSVTVYHNCRATVPLNPAYFRPLLRLGTSETLGTVISTTSTTYTLQSEALVRPGGGSWSVADLANLQVGIGLYAQIDTKASRCTQVYVVVDYTPAAVGFSRGFIIG